MTKRDDIAMLKDRLQRREAELAALQRIAMAVATAQDLPEILQTIVHLATQVMGCPKAAIFELDEGAGVLRLRAWEGLSAAHAEALQALDVGDPRAAAVLGGQPLAVGDVSADLTQEHIAELGRKEGFTAFIDVPLRSRERNLGILSAYYTDVHEFTSNEIEMFASFADQAAVALETAHLLRNQKRRIAELGSLEEIGRAISATLDLDETLLCIREQVSQLMDTTNFYIALYDSEQDEISFPLAYERGQRRPWGQRRGGHGLTEYIVRTGQPLLLKRNVNEELEKRGIQSIGAEAKSWLGVPLQLGGRTVGMMAVQSYADDTAYDEEHQRILMAVARQAAVAIQNARLFQEHKRRIAELAGLEEIGRAISATLDMEEALQRIREQVSRLMDTTNFYIALYDPQQDEVSFAIAYEGGQRRPWSQRRGGRGLTEHVIHTGQPLLLKGDVSKELEKRGIQAIGAEAKSWLGVPLQLGGRTVGMMAVQSYTDDTAYDEEHQRILMVIARQAAVVVENARTVSEMRRLNQDLQGTLDTQKQLLETIRELSTPVVPLVEGIILLPLVGHIDSNRARQVMDQVLVGVQRHSARIVIVDITGVPVVDTMVAQALVQTAQAVHLLGAEAVLVGIMPEVAQTMVGLGFDLNVLVTRSDLQSGLEYALERLRRWKF